MSKLPTQYPAIEVADGILRPVMHFVSQMFQRIAVAFNNPDYGNTSERPTIQLAPGQPYFDTTLNSPVWWDGAAWVLPSATATPGGSPNDVQFNSAGAFGGLTLDDGELLIGDTGGAPVPATLNAPAAGLTISVGAGSITFALAGDLAALEGLGTTGLAVRTGAATWATRTLTGPAAGISVSDGNGVSGNPTLALANDLAAIEALASTGLAVRTGADTWTQRTVTGAANRISLTDGNGVSGNPTIDIHTSYVGQNTITTLGMITTGVWNSTVIGEAYGGTGESTYTNGQLLIGNTGTGGLDKTTLTAGRGIAITNAAGAITVAAAPALTRVFLNANHANPGANTWGIVTWTTVDTDPLGAFAAGTPTYVTVPTGITNMRVTVRANWSNVTNSGRYLVIAVDTAGGPAAPYYGGDIRTSLNESLSSINTPWISVAAGARVALWHNPGASAVAVLVGNASITGVFAGATTIEFEWGA